MESQIKKARWKNGSRYGRRYIKTKYNHKIRKYRNIAFLSVLNFILFLSITSLYGNKIDTRLLYSIFFLLSFCFFILLDLECTDCLNCKK